MLKLMQGDCLERMVDIEDKSVNLILCDLPYGTSACKWDTVIPFNQLWEQYERIITDNGVIALFGSEPFSSLLRTSNLKLYKYDWKWEKPNGANFLNFKYQPNKVHEDILIFSKAASSYSTKGNMIYNPQMEEGKPYTIKQGKLREAGEASNFRSKIEQKTTVNEGTRYPRSILKFALDKDKYHPTQKPVALLEYLIKTYTNPEDIVLDNTMGSGSTGVAAVNVGRSFIGIEKDDNYFRIAEERINNTHTTLTIENFLEGI